MHLESISVCLAGMGLLFGAFTYMLQPIKKKLDERRDSEQILFTQTSDLSMRIATMEGKLNNGITTSIKQINDDIRDIRRQLNKLAEKG